MDIRVLKSDLQSHSNEELDSKYLNINRYSTDKLGAVLTMGHSELFDSLIGRCNSIRTGMDYLTVSDFPIELLTKNSLSKRDIDRIPKHKLDITNYWSAVGALLYGKLTSNVELVKELKANDKIIVSYNSVKRTFLGKEVITNTVNVKMITYTKLITEFSKLIKEDKFNDVNVGDLLTSFKKDPNVGIFHGCAVNINI